MLKNLSRLSYRALDPVLAKTGLTSLVQTKYFFLSLVHNEYFFLNSGAVSIINTVRRWLDLTILAFTSVMKLCTEHFNIYEMNMKTHNLFSIVFCCCFKIRICIDLKKNLISASKSKMKSLTKFRYFKLVNFYSFFCFLLYVCVLF